MFFSRKPPEAEGKSKSSLWFTAVVSSANETIKEIHQEL